MSYLRNHKLLLLIVSVLLIANIMLLYFYVFKEPEHPSKPNAEEMHKRAIQKVKEEVGLNDDQVTAYDSLRSNQFKNMKPLFNDLTKAKEDFFSLIYQQGVSDSALTSYAA